MKKEIKSKSAPLLSFSILVIMVVGFLFAINQWKRTITPVHQPTPTANGAGEGFVFGRVVSKNPSEFIKMDTANKKSIFDNGSISFVFDPSKFEISTFDLKDAPSGSGVKMEDIIIKSKTGEYSLVMKLKLDGIGGGCPDFPKSYTLSQSKLSGQSITKAKFIDQKAKSDTWPVGNIYLVGKTEINGQSEWNCPNVAGLESPKNGSSWIVYKLEKLQMDSAAYKNAEKSLDEIVSSISGFW